MDDVSEFFIRRAGKYWWSHVIGEHYSISPAEVKTWHANDIMESLARVALVQKQIKKETPNIPKKGG